MILFFTKLFVIPIIIALFSVHLTLWGLFHHYFLKKKLRSVVIPSFYCRLILKFLKIEVIDHTPKDKQTNRLIIANHLSYLDAIVLSATQNTLFVTSQEIASTPGLGLLTKLAGCHFVERRSIWGLKREVAELAQTLRDGYNLMIFPEGTTSAGNELLRFKSSLLQAAVDAKKPIQAICINYPLVNNQKPLLEHRDYVCWYASMEFLPHLIRLFYLKSLTIELSEVDYVDEPMKRKVITQTAKQKIAERFKPFPNKL